MKTKKKYNVDGEKINAKGLVARGPYYHMKSIAEARNQTKHEALEESIRLYNEKYKEVLS